MNGRLGQISLYPLNPTLSNASCCRHWNRIIIMVYSIKIQLPPLLKTNKQTNKKHPKPVRVNSVLRAREVELLVQANQDYPILVFFFQIHLQLGVVM